MSDSAGAGGGHGAQGDPATPTSLASSGHETAAPVTALTREERKAIKKARPRVNGVLAHRMEKFREKVERILLNDVADLAMSKHAFKQQHELTNLTTRQQRVAKEWEKPKKEIPMALLAANERVINAMRAQQAAPGVSINVERAVIRMPDTKPEREEDAIVIDVEATLAPG